MIGGRFSINRIMTLALGGAIGGLIAFIILNPFVRGKALFGDGDATQNWVRMGTMIGAVVGLAIGACLIAAEEWHTHNLKRILHQKSDRRSDWSVVWSARRPGWAIHLYGDPTN